ncbi:MAG: hypothetical protein OXH12_06615 [Chloroflexi bacterium]|nr:hypothetical protein [Chloroflexota bacterium]
MTTAASSIPLTTTSLRPTIETLVDRLIESIFAPTPEVPEQSLARTVHDTRRLRQAGDLDGALALFAGVDPATAEPHQGRWTYAEWLDLARRRFGGSGALVYSPGTGRAAVLAPRGDGSTLEVLTVLGMRWRPGKTVSRRSLRGLRPLDRGAS